MAFNIVKFVEGRRAGCVNPKAVEHAYMSTKYKNIIPYVNKGVESILSGGVNYMDFERKQHRFLLTAVSDGSLYIHDTRGFTAPTYYTCPEVGVVRSKTPNAHLYSVECVQWYPQDPAIFVSSGMDKQLKIWDSVQLKPVESVRFEGRVLHHDMSRISSQSLIAVASNTNNVMLVDMKTGSSTHQLRGHTGNVLTCKWSPETGYLLASGGNDGTILMWDVRSGRYLQSVDEFFSNKGTGTAHNGSVNGLQFTRDGLFLLSSGTDHRLRLWNTSTGLNEMVNYGTVLNKTLKSLQISVTENYHNDLVCIPSDGCIIIFDIISGSHVATLPGHLNAITCCVYNSHTHELYSGGMDRNILVWNAFCPLITPPSVVFSI